ncbi:ADP-ribosylglycohydrolase family protein [uncultured Dokdonia sp.]|uniref:ADP-ribosylglycohydrolase family protein n=1 Tax=uncultured Dokdonia sp. TaxID=575653 RepID=UPI0030EE904E|tara:strand:- start:3293 stop:4315 length:1023 start_codon:yes stop_codon:yes gene_type:complete
MINFSNLLVGLAIGDAYGAGVEFQDRNWIADNVDFTKFVSSRHLIKCRSEQSELFVKNYTDWDYTDDTEMTIGLMKALMSSKEFTEDNLVNAFKAEYDYGIEAKGYGRNGHGSMAWFYSGEKSIKEIRDFQRDRPNPGNAPTMRSVPLAFIEENLINDYCKINAQSTHPNALAVASSQVIAWAARCIVYEEGDKKSLINYVLEKMDFNSEFKVYLKHIDTLPFEGDLSLETLQALCGNQPIEPPYFLSGIEGLPSDSKYTAGVVLYILKHISDPFEGLKYAIQIGGDVDSSASIVTGILAARFGLTSLPHFMIENVEGREYVEQVGEKFNAFAKAKKDNI